MTGSRPDLTELLAAYSSGEPEALGALMPRIYDELRQLAHRHLARGRRGDTLLTTDLVHEVYLKLVDGTRVEVAGRHHFFALASRAMRQILIDHARARQALRRGSGNHPLTLDDALPVSDDHTPELLELDDALRRLESVSERRARIVEHRFFGGLTLEETAVALDISPATVKREWTLARAWLNRELGETNEHE